MLTQNGGSVLSEGAGTKAIIANSTFRGTSTKGVCTAAPFMNREAFACLSHATYAQDGGSVALFASSLICNISETTFLNNSASEVIHQSAFAAHS